MIFLIKMNHRCSMAHEMCMYAIKGLFCCVRILTHPLPNVKVFFENIVKMKKATGTELTNDLVLVAYFIFLEP